MKRLVVIGFIVALLVPLAFVQADETWDDETDSVKPVWYYYMDDLTSVEIQFVGGLSSVGDAKAAIEFLKYNSGNPIPAIYQFDINYNEIASNDYNRTVYLSHERLDRCIGSIVNPMVEILLLEGDYSSVPGIYPFEPFSWQLWQSESGYECFYDSPDPTVAVDDLECAYLTLMYYWETLPPDCPIDDSLEGAEGDDVSWFRSPLLMPLDPETMSFLYENGVPDWGDFFDHIIIRRLNDGQPNLPIERITITLNNSPILEFQYTSSPLDFNPGDSYDLTEAILAYRVQRLRGSSRALEQLSGVDLLNEYQVIDNGPYCPDEDCGQTILARVASDYAQFWDSRYASFWYDETPPWDPDGNGERDFHFFEPGPDSWCSDYAVHVLRDETDFNDDERRNDFWLNWISWMIGHGWHVNNIGIQQMYRLFTFYAEVSGWPVLYINGHENKVTGEKWEWKDLACNLQPGYYTGLVYPSAALKGDKGAHSTFFVEWTNNCEAYNSVTGSWDSVSCQPTSYEGRYQRMRIVGHSEEFSSDCAAVFYAIGGNQSQGRVMKNPIVIHNLVDTQCPGAGSDELPNWEVDYQTYWVDEDPIFNPETNSPKLTLAIAGFGNTYALEWQDTYNTTSGGGYVKDTSTDVAVDGSLNSYIVGVNYNTTTHYHSAFTIKYDSYGYQEWVRTRNFNLYDVRPRTITHDGRGNVYTTGLVQNYDSPYDSKSVTMKYDRHGSLVWTSDYSLQEKNSLDIDDYFYIHADGEAIYITGVFHTNSSGTDILTIRYNAETGAEEWAIQYNGPDSLGDFPRAITTDVDNNVYVTGASKAVGSDVTACYDFITLKYDSAGSLLWEARYNGEADNEDVAVDIHIDEFGFVYVTGYSIDPECGRYEIVTLKYNQHGYLLWESKYNNHQNCYGWDQPVGLGFDAHGNIYVVGTSMNDDSGMSGQVDGVVIKYDNAGQQQWARRYYDPLEDGGEVAQDMAVSAKGNVYALMRVSLDSLTTDYQLRLIKYNSNGVREMEETVPFAVSNDGYARMAMDHIQHLYAVGTTDEDDSDAFIYKHPTYYCECEICSADECEVEGRCYTNGERHPLSPCLICVGGNEWTELDNMTPCDDGIFCNGPDYCYSGVCGIHGSSPCDPQCQACNEQYHECNNIAAGCDDGEFCNGADQCFLGACSLHIGSPCDPQCQSCDETNDVCDDITGPCDDELFCNGLDECLNGACDEHAGDPCEENEQCIEETDECMPLTDDDTTPDDDTTDDDTTDDDTIDDDTTGDDDDDDICNCGGGMWDAYR